MAITMAIALLVGFISLLLFFWRSILLRPSLRLPPGPRPLPIVGNLLMMRKYASTADFANELKRKYGPIVTLWIGSKPVVIISEPKIIQEAMITQGSVFVGRAQLQSMKIVLNGYRGMAYAHGERHRFLRKIMVSEILSNKRVAGFRPIREQEIDILVENLKKQAFGKDDNKGPGIVTNFRSLIRLAVCNFIVGILFGRRLTPEEYGDLDEVMIQRFQLAIGKPSDFIPWLAWLPDRKSIKVQRELRGAISRILDPLIEERRQVLKLAKTDHHATFVDTLLELRDGKIKSPVEITDADVVTLSIELLTLGTDTTALNLEYCVANLINNPEIQEKLAREISAVVGERVVNEDDIPHLPFLQAVVKEALRRHSPGRLAPPRRALSATKVAGYDIPVDTFVQQHLEAVSLNPLIWENPLEFRPERHVNRSLDITGSTEITMIPFGVGRRICPAINVAFLHAELILARLIQAFEWKSTTPGQLLDVTPGGVFSNPMKYPLVASLQDRLKVS